MKHSGRVVSLGLLLCAAVVPCFGAVINYVEFGLAQGGTAVYDASAGTIAWSGGASGKLRLIDDSYLYFNQDAGAGVTIAGNVSGAPGSGSSISLNNLTFTLTFAPYGQTLGSSIVISGALSSGAAYEEKIGGIGGLGATLTGKALVDVGASLINGPFGESFEWVQPYGSSLGTSIIGVKNFTNYLQDYTTNNLKITVEGQIPEPATMSLLAIGAVGMLIKRKK